MTKVIIWGATGQAVVIEELLINTDYQIVALFDNNTKIKSPIYNVPIFYGEVGLSEWLSKVPREEKYFYVLAIGGHGGLHRESISLLLNKNGFEPLSLIHHSAQVAKNVKLGKGIQILINSTICARVEIGDFVIVNSLSCIDHECKIGPYSHIGPGAIIAGCVKIEKNVFIGSNATILPNLTIGENTVIGAGAVVTKSIPANSVAYGNPAIIKSVFSTVK